MTRLAPFARIGRRPTPADWAADDKMTLKEAVRCSGWRPADGRIPARRHRQRPVDPCSGRWKAFHNPAQRRAMFRPAPCPAGQKGQVSTGCCPDRLRELGKPLPNTSPRRGHRPPENQSAVPIQLPSMSLRSWPSTSRTRPVFARPCQHEGAVRFASRLLEREDRRRHEAVQLQSLCRLAYRPCAAGVAIPRCRPRNSPMIIRLGMRRRADAGHHPFIVWR